MDLPTCCKITMQIYNIVGNLVKTVVIFQEDPGIRIRCQKRSVFTIMLHKEHAELPSFLDLTVGEFLCEAGYQGNWLILLFT